MAVDYHTGHLDLVLRSLIAAQTDLVYVVFPVAVVELGGRLG